MICPLHSLAINPSVDLDVLNSVVSLSIYSVFIYIHIYICVCVRVCVCVYVYVYIYIERERLLIFLQCSPIY